MRTMISALVLAAVLAPAGAAGQELARRVAGMDDGTLRLSFETRPGVEICDRGIRMNDHTYMWRSGSWDDEPRNCRVGSAEVELRVRSGLVRDVEILLEEGDRTRDAVDVGLVPPREAVDLFLAVARGEVGPRSEEDAIFPVVLADVEGVPILMEVARTAKSADTRSSAMFWLAQSEDERVYAFFEEILMGGG